MNTVCFVFVCEPGLERKARLLARSIREWCGSLRHVPIHCVSPKNRDISLSTQMDLERLECHFHKKLLNDTSYHYASKSASVAWVAENHPRDIVCWLDTDKVFFREPTELMWLTSRGHDFAARPVDKRGIGYRYQNELTAQHWLGLYERLAPGESHEPRLVATTVDSEIICEYYQGGMFAAQPKLFEPYNETVMNVKRRDNQLQLYLEQSAMGAVATALAESPHILPRSYNYPLHFHNEKWSDNSDKFKSFNETVSIHYHAIFDREEQCDLKWLGMREDIQYHWLQSQIGELQLWKDAAR